MSPRLPALFVNVGHDHSYLSLIQPRSGIGIVASAAYPPDPAVLARPRLRAAVRVLDPLTFQLPLPASVQKAPFKRLPYASANVDPARLVANQTERQALVGAVTAYSAAWGADFVVAPYFHAVDPGDPAFEASLALAEDTAAAVGIDKMIPAIFVHQNALLPQHVDTLLTRLTGTPFGSLYLLVNFDAPSTAPISSDSLLAGLKLVFEVLAQNGISVLCGATDTTGVMAVAWADLTSYALGPETFLRRRRQPATTTAAGGFRAAARRVFATELLSELKVADYESWAARGLLPCACSACTQRGAVAGRLAHYVNAHAGLTERLVSATDRPPAMARVLDRAMALIGSGGSSDVDARRHLARWRTQLP